MVKEAFEKIDLFVDRAKKYTIFIGAIIMVFWGASSLWSSYLNFRSNYYQNKDETNYQFDRQEKLRKRAIQDGNLMYKDLQSTDNKQWKKMVSIQEENNKLKIELLEYQKTQAYKDGLWDGRWELMKKKQ